MVRKFDTLNDKRLELVTVIGQLEHLQELRDLLAERLKLLEVAEKSLADFLAKALKAERAVAGAKTVVVETKNEMHLTAKKLVDNGALSDVAENTSGKLDELRSWHWPPIVKMLSVFF